MLPYHAFLEMVTRRAVTVYNRYNAPLITSYIPEYVKYWFTYTAEPKVSTNVKICYMSQDKSVINEAVQ
jgi:hypothetical protein